MRIGESLARLSRRLSDQGIPDAGIEAEVLLRHVVGLERAEFFAALDEPLSRSNERQADKLLHRRLEGEPLAYIAGSREFYGLQFLIDRHVLVPRQETELLVDRALEWASTRPTGERLRIADIGTGCGAIAIATARRLPDATVFATDVSAEALRVADANRRRHGLLDRVRLRQGDLLAALDGQVDLIVSNPPYIRTDDIPRLAAEVRHEPLQALDGGPDGLRVTSRLIRRAPAYLGGDGCLLVEIAPEQLDRVTEMARRAMPKARVSFARDLLGLPRVVTADLEPRPSRADNDPGLGSGVSMTAPGAI